MVFRRSKAKGVLLEPLTKSPNDGIKKSHKWIQWKINVSFIAGECIKHHISMK